MPELRDTDRSDETPARFRIRLPGFVADREIGLGEVVHRVAATAGLHPCGGCLERAAALNRWVVFSPGRR